MIAHRYVGEVSQRCLSHLWLTCPSSCFWLFNLELEEVDIPFVVTEEVFDEVLRTQPEPVVAHVTEAVTLTGEDKEVEALVGMD